MLNTSEVLKAVKPKKNFRVKTSREIIQERLDKEFAQFEQAEKVLKVLEKFEGKKFTKRILEPIRKELNSDDVHFFLGDHDFSSCKIQNLEWTNSGCERGFSLNLGRGKKCPIISMEYIKEENDYFCHGIKSNIENAREKLASNYPERVDQAAAKLREEKKEFAKLIEESNSKYQLEKLGDIRPPKIEVENVVSSPYAVFES
tara:strand:+ start:214 stop:819 length:606 start_codon:yes stop_codon:yes gene_type:complete